MVKKAVTKRASKKTARNARPVDALIGGRIRARRLEIRMSQEQLAALLQVTFQQIQKYEKGVNRVAAGRIPDIAAAFGVPVTYFFDGIPPSFGGGADVEVEETRPFTRDEIELLLIVRSLSPLVRKRALKIIQALAEE